MPTVRIPSRSPRSPGPTQDLVFVMDSTGKAQLGITVPVPDFLVQAHTQAAAGHSEAAKALMSPENLRPIEKAYCTGHCHVQVLFLVGEIWYWLREWDPARQWLERANHVRFHGLICFRLGEIYAAMGRIGEAVDLHRQAHELDPDNPYISRSYATHLMRGRRVEEGMRLLHEAYQRAPDNPQFHSQYLFRLNYLRDRSADEIRDEVRQWALRHAPLSLARLSHGNPPHPDRRLKIGYLSSDFREHAMLGNFEPLLDDRHAASFEVYGYGSVGAADHVTRRLAGKFDHYRDIQRFNDDAAADQIVQDQIDILVVCGGHVPDNRLRVCAYKPAPIQVDFGGVPTTGMAQVDYRFTDRFQDGPDSEPYYTERPIYLPTGVVCFAPPSDTPEVGPLPAIQHGQVTFASFSNNLKITDPVLYLWAGVLKAVEGSRLLLKFKGGELEEVRRAYVESLVRMGVDRRRVDVYGWTSPMEHWRLYATADVALDTFPYGGCTTSLEALWMGLPLITLAGRPQGYWMSRFGSAVLSRTGLQVFTCHTEAEYIAKATALARDLSSLAKIRASMRPRLLTPGGICDTRTHIRAVEAAYRWMWQKWCDSKIKDQRSKIKNEESGT